MIFGIAGSANAYGIAWFKHHGYYFATYENENWNNMVRVVSLAPIPVIPDGLAIADKIRHGDLPGTVVEVLKTGATLGMGRALVVAGGYGSKGIDWLINYSLEETPALVYNGVSYLVDPNIKTVSRDKFTFGIYKHMYGNANIGSNGLYVDPDYCTKQDFKKRLAQIDKAFTIGNDGSIYIDVNNSNVDLYTADRIAWAYYQTVEAIANDTLEDVEIMYKQ